MITIHEWQILHSVLGLLIGSLFGIAATLIGHSVEVLNDTRWTAAAFLIPTLLGAIIGPFVQVVP